MLNRPVSPKELYGALFEDVQLSGLFKDSKVFADAIAQGNHSEILQTYEENKNKRGFNLEAFVYEHFSFNHQNSTYEADPSQSIEEHIERLWSYLERQPHRALNSDSLIPLSHPYVASGDRIQELYYWDSYFIMLGLVESGRLDMIEHMVANFSNIINNYSYIPYGNRSYYMSRSNPPFFAAILELLAAHKGEDIVYDQYLDPLLKEYRFWTDGWDGIAEGEVYRRLVKFKDGTCLNRYWDDYPEPRQESYAEDVKLALNSNRPLKDLWRNVRAACESGWEFSSRWLADPMKLDTIQTINVLPIDLNVLLYKAEYLIAKALLHRGKDKESVRFVVRSGLRKEAINHYFWNDHNLLYLDYNWKENRSLQRPSLAMVFPLWAELASDQQALATANYLEKHLLQSGGLITTSLDTGQEWDAPNAWAPLQWIAVEGLRKYQFNDLASEISRRFCHTVELTFQKTGNILEKYNVVDPKFTVGNGECPAHDRFGWTSGVYLALKNNNL